MKRRSYVAAIGAGTASFAGLAAFTRPESILGLGKGKRAEGEKTSVKKSIIESEVTYLEKTDEVRYPTVYSGGEPQEYTTEDFKRWAKQKAASVGATVVLSTIKERLDTPVHGVGKSVGGRFFQTVIFLEYITPRDQESELPDLSFQEVIKVAPREVQVTVVLEGEQYTRSVPVIVRKSKQGQPD